MYNWALSTHMGVFERNIFFAACGLKKIPIHAVGNLKYSCPRAIAYAGRQVMVTAHQTKRRRYNL